MQGTASSGVMSVYPPPITAASAAELHILLRDSTSLTRDFWKRQRIAQQPTTMRRRQMQRLTPLHDGMVALPVSAKGQRMLRRFFIMWEPVLQRGSLSGLGSSKRVQSVPGIC